MATVAQKTGAVAQGAAQAQSAEDKAAEAARKKEEREKAIAEAKAKRDAERAKKKEEGDKAKAEAKAKREEEKTKAAAEREAEAARKREEKEKKDAAREAARAEAEEKRKASALVPAAKKKEKEEQEPVWHTQKDEHGEDELVDENKNPILITCCDCGAERWVTRSQSHEVVRCKPCARKHKRRKGIARRKQQVKDHRAIVAEALELGLFPQSFLDKWGL